MIFLAEIVALIVLITVIGPPLSRAIAKRIEGGPDLKALCGIVDGLISRIDTLEEDVQQLESENRKILELAEFDQRALEGDASQQHLTSG